MHLRVLDGLRTTVNATLVLGARSRHRGCRAPSTLTASYSPRIQTGTATSTCGELPIRRPNPQLCLRRRRRPRFRWHSTSECGPASAVHPEQRRNDRQRRCGHHRHRVQARRHGRVLLDRGEWTFLGNRYRVQGA
jgi:hypothetical protein